MGQGRPNLLDASRSRPLDGGPSFSLGNRLVRLIWVICWPMLAAWTPRQMAGWRRFLLRLFGARMGARSDVRGSARIWYPPNLHMAARAVIGPGVNCYNQAMVTLGEDVLISQGAFLCCGTHDIDDPHFQLVTREIVIGRGAWIAAEAFLGPGTSVGDHAVIGARAVAFGQVAAETIYRGNPATPLRRRANIPTRTS